MLNKEQEVILHSCELRLKDAPIHKRLAVLRYMKKFIENLAAYQVEAAVALDTGKGELPEEIEYRLNLASERYDGWMAKHNRVMITKEEKARAKEHLQKWADSGMKSAVKAV